jgi:casein kinase II subunit beta
MILDVEPEDDEDEEEEEEDDDDAEESVEGDSRVSRRAQERRHNRMASDLSVIESSAELLYGLIHQRYICSRAGIQQMSEKYEMSHFGNCPRTNCDHARTLPVGLSDVPGQDTVKLFCPSCLDVYIPPNSRFQTVDGAFFGRTFGALFLMTFPDYDISKKATEVLTANAPRAAANPQIESEKEMINGMLATNLAPGLGVGKVYEPRVYGFKVSERARSGPRMGWLRSRPANIQDLDEVQKYGQHIEESDDEDGTPVRLPPPKRKIPAANGGSPMSIEPSGGGEL